MKNEEKKSFKCGCVYPCEDYPSCGGTKITLGEPEKEEKGTEQVGYVNQLFDTLKKYYSDQDRTLAQMLKTIADLESSRDQFSIGFADYRLKFEWNGTRFTRNGMDTLETK